MIYETDYLAHYGVKGQKWGVRRFQNEDGSLTNEGKNRYGYKGDSTGKFNGIKKALSKGSNAVGSRIRKALKTRKDNFVQKHKPVSAMTDQELRERSNRMQMESNYKRLQDELSGKNKHKPSFGEKHPIMKQVFVNTAVNTAANLVSRGLQTKADELLAEKRMKRAKEKNMLREELIPFVSKETAGRIAAWNKTQASQNEREAKVLDRIKGAVSEAVGKEREGHQRNLERAVEVAKRQLSDELFDKHSVKLQEVAQNVQRTSGSRSRSYKLSGVRSSSRKNGVKLAWDGLSKNLGVKSVKDINGHVPKSSSPGIALIREALEKKKKS